MSDHHFFVEPADINGGVLALRGDEAHHAARVLRITPGETITAADGTGLLVTAVVTSIGEVVKAGIEREEHRSLPLPLITLVQAVGKSDVLEVVVEKATEVGVHRIVPFIAERTVVRWDERKLERVHERLRSIAKAAAKQSKAPFVPDIEPVMSSLSAVAADGLVIALHESAPVRLRDVLPVDAPQTLSLVVGPEGGLTPEETEALTIASLGRQILRTETAGPVVAAVVAFKYGWFA